MDEEIKAREIHEDACRSAMEAYKSLIDIGVARELARTVLPCGTFTEFYINMNLNNFLKFLTLRMADDTQTETREIANAMFELCRPLSPAIFDTHSNMTDGIYLSRDEVCAIQNKQDELCSGGRRENVEYKDKLKTLGIYTYDQSSQSI
jgi:thymidylate synthase (FAD)